MSQPDANRFAPRQTVIPQNKPDVLRERASHLVSRLGGVKHRLSELRYNLIGVTTEMEAVQGGASANPLPLAHVSASTMEILATVAEIEIILTDLEANI